MNEPQRILIDPAASAFERSLLEAWKDERPSKAARDRTLAALGLAAGASIGAAAGGSIAPKAAGVAWVALLKWLAVGALAVGGATTAAILVQRANAPSPDALVLAPGPLLPRSHDDAPKVDPVVTPNAISSAIDVTSLAPARVQQAQTPAHATFGTLSEEIAVVDRARSALVAGDTTRALHLVDDYESRYPNGTFTQEADVIRIDALARSGNHDAANRAGARFLASYPKSPHAARVRALIGAE